MAAGVPIEPLARYFEYWLLRLQGVYEPDPRGLGRGAGVPGGGAHVQSVRARPDVRGRRGETLRELEAAHRALIAMHLEKDLKSVRVLREMQCEAT